MKPAGFQIIATIAAFIVITTILSLQKSLVIVAALIVNRFAYDRCDR